MLLASRIVGKKVFDCTSFTCNLTGKQEFSTLFHKVCTGTFCSFVEAVVWCLYRLPFVCTGGNIFNFSNTWTEIGYLLSRQAI